MGKCGNLFGPSHPNPQIVHLIIGDLTNTIKIGFPTRQLPFNVDVPLILLRLASSDR